MGIGDPTGEGVEKLIKRFVCEPVEGSDGVGKVAAGVPVKEPPNCPKDPDGMA